MDGSLKIEFHRNGSKGAVILKKEGKVGAEMTYSIASPELIIIDHTDVNADYRGRNFGRKLLDALVEKARKESFKIMPLCPFARGQFEKDSSIRDVMK
jgi:hypothetical protein